jgi:hypothetical protein
MKRYTTMGLVLLGMILAQLACNAPVPIPLTGTGTGSTITPVQIGTPATPPAGDASGTCTNKVTFVSDVTVPDNTEFNAGEAFTKTWRVRNDGTCTWGPSSPSINGLVHTGGDQMGGPNEVPLAGAVQPGETVDISVNFTAPTTPGSYVSQWMFRVNAGAGDAQTLGVGANGKGTLYTQIVVK